MSTVPILFQSPESLEALKRLVMNSVDSHESKRLYGRAVDRFVQWNQTEAASGGFNRGTVLAFKAHLIETGLSSSGVNAYLIPIRRMAAEAADNGLLSSELAGGIGRIKGVRRRGVRVGNWLTISQADGLLGIPGTDTLKGKRDTALLSVLVSCGLRREETASLSLQHIQQRGDRWIIADLVGKGRRFRAVPMPSWTKDAIDVWIQAAGVAGGRVFRPINRGGKIAGESMTAQSIFETIKRYTAKIGLPAIAPHDLRRTFARLAYDGRAPLEQIQLSLGHSSSDVTQKYLGIELDLKDAPCDRLGLRR